MDRGVTVRPNPAPNNASAAAALPTDVPGVQPAIISRPTIDAPSPTSVTTRSESTRTANPDTSAAAALALFGAGFGLTVTPRSTAAVEAVSPEAYGIASSTVTVARMIGMAVGLAILTAYGSTTIDRLYDQVYATPNAYQQYVPESLQGRPLKDPLVVGALESWAASEAARIMVGIFLVAAGVTALAVPPALLLDRRRRMLGTGAPAPVPSAAPGADGAV